MPAAPLCLKWSHTGQSRAGLDVSWHRTVPHCTLQGDRSAEGCPVPCRPCSGPWATSSPAWSAWKAATAHRLQVNTHCARAGTFLGGLQAVRTNDCRDGVLPGWGRRLQCGLGRGVQALGALALCQAGAACMRSASCDLPCCVLLLCGAGAWEGARAELCYGAAGGQAVPLHPSACSCCAGAAGRAESAP